MKRKFGVSISRIVILWMVVFSWLMCFSAQYAQQRERGRVLSTRELSIRVSRSLVVVMTQDREGNLIAQASGFFFKPGLVATNLHVLKRASQGYVRSVSEGITYKILSVVGFDLKHDLCIVQLVTAGGVPLPLSTNDVTVGDEILVGGNPEGLEGSFSKGIISGIRRASGLLQMDAAISPGSSGGPVVNQRGEVIGLAVSSLAEGQHLNFAVPVRYLRDLRLVGDLPLRTAGGLAVTSLEEEGFRGPVRIVTESKAEYKFSRSSNAGVEEPAFRASTKRFNPDGQLEEITYFVNEAEFIREVREYSQNGLIKRETKTERGVVRESREYSAEDAVYVQASHIYFDETARGGSLERKYDNRGNQIESTFEFEKKVRKWVMKYDSRQREVEEVNYLEGKLDSVRHFTYEDNQRGDWIKQHQTLWVADYPDSGFTPEVDRYREIEYYGESATNR